MIEHRITPGEPVILNEQAEIFITKIIAETVYGLPNITRVHAYNICKDHVHALIECNSKILSNTIRLLKGKSSQRYKEYLGIDSGKEFHLWAQKYNKWLITSDEQYNNTFAYIIGNRMKHGLPENKWLQPLVLSMIQSSCDSEYYISYEKEIARIYGCDRFSKEKLCGLTDEEIWIVEGK